MPQSAGAGSPAPESRAGAPLPRKGPSDVAANSSTVSKRWDTGRMEAFSDGVFAIAITLLVLDLSVPESAFDHLWHGIGHQWPSYLGYVTSFLTIGGIWMGHHTIFRRMRYANASVMRVNLVLLMAVSFLPFPTRLVAEAIRNEGAERAAVIFYGISLFTVSVLVSALWYVIRREPELLKSEVTDAEISAITRGTTPDLGGYLAATVLALFFPKAAAIGYLVTAAFGIVRARGDGSSEPSQEPADAEG
jgi:uncharacterized membrane protein